MARHMLRLNIRFRSDDCLTAGTDFILGQANPGVGTTSFLTALVTCVLGFR